MDVSEFEEKTKLIIEKQARFKQVAGKLTILKFAVFLLLLLGICVSSHKNTPMPAMLRVILLGSFFGALTDTVRQIFPELPLRDWLFFPVAIAVTIVIVLSAFGLLTFWNAVISIVLFAISWLLFHTIIKLP